MQCMQYVSAARIFHSAITRKPLCRLFGVSVCVCGPEVMPFLPHFFVLSSPLHEKTINNVPRPQRPQWHIHIDEHKMFCLMTFYAARATCKYFNMLRRLLVGQRKKRILFYTKGFLPTKKIRVYHVGASACWQPTFDVFTFHWDFTWLRSHFPQSSQVL